MALFDKRKFLNFYGYVPNVLDVDNFLDVNGVIKKGISRASGKISSPFSDKRPENPITDESRKKNASVCKLTIVKNKPKVVKQGESKPKIKEEDKLFEFNPPPVITVNLKKNVVTTKVAGANQTPVVEIIGFDTFQIKIQGYMDNQEHKPLKFKKDKFTQMKNAFDFVETDVSNSGGLSVREDKFPLEKLEKLRKLFNRNEALYVQCDLLEKMGITQIVITSIPDMTYYPSAFTYTINAIADKHKELEVLQK